MKNKNKIRICYPFVGDSVGGSHLSMIEIIKNLNKSKFDPFILLHKKGILYNYLNNQGLNPKIIKINNYVGSKKGILNNSK